LAICPFDATRFLFLLLPETSVYERSSGSMNYVVTHWQSYRLSPRVALQP
jgi:hypothetical protein